MSPRAGETQSSVRSQNIKRRWIFMRLGMIGLVFGLVDDMECSA
jgi:hypothetical protein